MLLVRLTGVPFGQMKHVVKSLSVPRKYVGSIEL